MCVYGGVSDTVVVRGVAGCEVTSRGKLPLYVRVGNIVTGELTLT